MAYYECTSGNTELTLSEWSEEIKYGEIFHIPTSTKVIFLASAYPIYDEACQQYPQRNQLDPNALLGKTPTMSYDSINNNVVMSLSKSSGTETYRVHAVNTFDGYNGGSYVDLTIDWDARIITATASITGSGFMYCTLS